MVGLELMRDIGVMPILRVVFHMALANNFNCKITSKARESVPRCEAKHYTSLQLYRRFYPA